MPWSVVLSPSSLQPARLDSRKAPCSRHAHAQQIPLPAGSSCSLGDKVGTAATLSYSSGKLATAMFSAKSLASRLSMMACRAHISSWRLLIVWSTHATAWKTAIPSALLLLAPAANSCPDSSVMGKEAVASSQPHQGSTSPLVCADRPQPVNDISSGTPRQGLLL